jgi:hypothetical protein
VRVARAVIEDVVGAIVVGAMSFGLVVLDIFYCIICTLIDTLYLSHARVQHRI